MSSVVISGDTSGAITLSAPAVSGTNTATLPAATGTVMVSGNMPAFYAYSASNQSITGNSTTKLQVNTEVFDTASCYDNATNYRFTPNVAGYYQISGNCYWGTNSVRTLLIIFKNGAAFVLGNALGGDSGGYAAGTVSSLIYMNGTTDYVELYLNPVTNTVTALAGTAPYYTWFSGVLVRNA